jgi:hypothetical protein
VVKATERMRCEDCGVYLFSELARAGMRSVSAYLLPKGEFNAQFHVQCQHAILPVVDNLPHYKAFPAAFGGAEEFVDWYIIYCATREAVPRHSRWNRGLQSVG